MHQQTEWFRMCFLFIFVLQLAWCAFTKHSAISHDSLVFVSMNSFDFLWFCWVGWYVVFCLFICSLFFSLGEKESVTAFVPFHLIFIFYFFKDWIQFTIIKKKKQYFLFCFVACCLCFWISFFIFSLHFTLFWKKFGLILNAVFIYIYMLNRIVD